MQGRMDAKLMKQIATDGCKLSRQGFSLPEVLVAVTILAILLGSVVAIFLSCGRSWRRGTAESRAQQATYQAVRRIAPDIRAAMSVTPFPAPYNNIGITLQLPARAFNSGAGAYHNTLAIDSHGKPYLVAGNKVNYFRGDAAGQASLTGDRVWRVMTNYAGTTEIKRSVIAQGLIDNPVDADGNAKPMFIYWPDIFRLKSVETTVTFRAQEAQKTAVATLVDETSLRNR